jgi:hypothetical protein
MDSSLHTLGGFLDVGNDQLFSSQNPHGEWLRDICQTLSAIERPPSASNLANPSVSTAPNATLSTSGSHAVSLGSATSLNPSPVPPS